MKNRIEVAMMSAAMVSAAAALATILLLAPEPGLGQAPLDDHAKAAAQAALAKANFEATAGVLTVYDRQGKVVRTVGERAVYSFPVRSPDGKRMAVVKRDETTQYNDIWVFDFSTGEGTRITFDPAAKFSLVWSPDGSQIAYASNPGGSLGLYRKAANGTGSSELLYQHPDGPYTTDWSPDGRFLTFYTGTPNSLYVLPLNAVGEAPSGPGERKAIEVVRRQFVARGGSFSPDSRFLAYASRQSGRPEIWVRPLDPSASDGAAPAAGPWQISDQGGLGQIAWRQDGKEMYYLAADGGVMAVEVSTAPAFKSGKPRLLFKAPDAFPVSANPINGPSVSRDGQEFLFAIPPKPRGARYPRQVTVFDRQGKVVRTLGEAGAYTEPVLSPDGTQVAAWLNGIRVFDVSTGTSVQVTPSARPANSPVWSPDASQFVFFGRDSDGPGRYRIASNGTGAVELLDRTELGIHLALTDWSPDGRFLSYSEGGVLWAVPVNGERKAMELMREEFSVYGARFSPGSRYIAYVSDESGRKEVYVRPFDSSSGFAPGGAKWQVSKEGGLGLVQWRQDGRELYYLATDGGVMAVEIATAPAFQAGPPKLLFRAPDTFTLVGIFNDRGEGTNAPDCSCQSGRGCEQGSISRDGQRFAFAVPLPPKRQEVAVAPGILAKYMGTYVEGERNWMVGSGEWVVTLEGNQLMIQRTGQEKAPLFAESETKFFLKATNGDFEFVKDDKGDVTYIFMYRGGSPTQAIRK